MCVCVRTHAHSHTHTQDGITPLHVAASVDNGGVELLLVESEKPEDGFWLSALSAVDKVRAPQARPLTLWAHRRGAGRRATRRCTLLCACA